MATIEELNVEMLDVLQQVLRSLKVLSPATHDGLLGGKIRNVIAKATGEVSQSKTTDPERMALR